MNYIEVAFTISENIEVFADILTAEIADLGFETFQETDEGMVAYIPVDQFSEKELKNILTSLSFANKVTYQTKEIEQQNWNEEWEKNYDPIIVKNTCLIRAPFHTNLPSYPMEVIITPKMAFGTGHHATTSLMVEYLLKNNYIDKNVLDMGCGSGVLAIVAAKMGAKHVTAIDIDEWAYENTTENIELNQVITVEALQGSSDVIPDSKFDYILANINRNILLDQLATYAQRLTPDGVLFMSGFLPEDVEIIANKAAEYKLKLIDQKELNNWVAAQFKFE